MISINLRLVIEVEAILLDFARYIWVYDVLISRQLRRQLHRDLKLSLALKLQLSDI